MASDYFLKLEGVEGESADAKHKGEIQLESFSFGVSQMGAHGAGGGGGAGKASFQDLHFVMKANKASPKLFLMCATGEHIKKAVLTARKAGKDQQEYYQVTLSDLLVSSFQTGGSSHGDVVPTDQLSLNFAKIEFEYKPQKEDGTLGAAVKAGYDVKANKKV
jgi:type VI secretion system secreted protein Hcp